MSTTDPPLALAPPADPLKRAKRAPLLSLNNARLVDSASPPPTPTRALDSSLKRHTTLLNKLRKGFSLDQKDALVKDIDGLTLEKYTEEIVDACVEGISGLGAKGDVLAVAEILTALSRRLPSTTFLEPLLSQLTALLAPPSAAALKSLPAEQRDREEKERVTKQRGVLRALAEAELCGLRMSTGGGGRKGKEVEREEVWCTDDGVKGLLASDPIYSSLPLITSFLKSFARPYLGPGSAMTASTEDDAAPSTDIELVPIDIQAGLRAAFKTYYDSLSKNVHRGRTRLQEQDLKNHEAYIKSGEIFEDRQQAYEKMTKEVERLMAGMTLLADLLHLPAPVFPTLAASKGTSTVLVLDNANPFSRGGIEDIPLGGMWEDDEQRRFYEDLPDLAELVPAGLLGVETKDQDAEKPDSDAQARYAEEEREREMMEQVQRELEGFENGAAAGAAANPDAAGSKTAGDSRVVTPKAEPAELPSSSVVADDSSTSLASGPLARLNAVFAALPDVSSKAAIDQLAVDFAFLNSKASRKRLIKFIGAVPKNRSDLLPIWSRMIAVLDPYMSDLGPGIIAILDEEFRYLQRKKLVRELAEVRAKNIRFYSELAKFKIAKPHTILHVYKVLIDDLSGTNIECAALLLENCGRFLLRTEETSEKMKAMLELMRRKQNAQHLDQRLQLLLENAYYQCNPPERLAVQQKERSPMELFIRHLIHDILIKKTVDKVLKLVRKLHWEDPKVYELLHKAFTRVWKLKFSNIGALALVLYDLARFHSEFATGVVDQVLENIRSGLETNIFKHNQRRIATIKFLGELHYFRQVNSAVIFDTLWSLITFGHSEPLPVPGRSCPVDSADDFFRVRLICTLLDTCGMCFDKGSAKKKLDQFLVIFQLYVLCKQPTPMDVDFMLTDTFELIRPGMTLFKTFDDAGRAVDELMATQALHPAAAGDSDESSDDSDDGEDDRRDDDLGDDVALTARIDDGDSEGEEEADGASDSDVLSGDDGDDDLVVRSLAKDSITQEEEDEFNKEFAKLLVDQSDSKKGDRKVNIPVFDTAVPLMRRARPAGGLRGMAAADEEQPAQDGFDEAGVNSMKFMLLTKKGNKPQTRMMDIPSNASIAVSTRSNQALDKQEQLMMKKLVLEQDRRQDDSEKRAMEAAARARGIKLRFIDQS